MSEILLILAVCFVVALILSVLMSRVFLETYKPDHLIFLNYFMLVCSSVLLNRLGEKYNIFEDYLDATYIFLMFFTIYAIEKRIWSHTNGRLK